MKYSNDNYEFASCHREEMMAELKMMESDSRWIDISSTRSVRIDGLEPADLMKAFSPQSMFDYNLASIKSKVGNDEYEDMFAETTSPDGTKLLASFIGESQFLRPCAMPSVYRSAKISGSALGRLMKKDPKGLGDLLNICYTVAEGSSLALVRGEKCCAILSDRYVVMPIIEIVQTAEKKLRERFGEISFVQGYNAHYYTSMVYELTEAADDLMTKYQDAVNAVGHCLRGVNYTPCVRVSSSDTGFSAATLSMYFKAGNSYVSFVSPLKTDHRRGNGHACGMESFEQMCGQVFAKFEDTMKVIGEMASFTVYHPLDFIDNIGKRILLSEEIIQKAKEEHRMLGTGQCSMHDVYLSIYDGFSDVTSPTKRIDIEEKVCRILSLNWKEFDYKNGKNGAK